MSYKFFIVDSKPRLTPFVILGLIGKIVKCRRQVRALSTVAEQVYVQDESVPNFRTTESNPVNHKLEHLHKIYTIPEEDLAAAFNQLTPDYREQNKTFCELGLLIRKPALEIMSYLKNADYSRPVNRYVLCILLWRNIKSKWDRDPFFQTNNTFQKIC